MKKTKTIGVATYCKSENYGAFLQCVALQKALSKYDISVIDYTPQSDKRRYAIINPKNLKSTAINLATLPILLKRKKGFRKAISTLRFTPTTKHYDIAITGSDQVWNPELTDSKLDEIFTLEKIKATKKIAYAASVANETVINAHREEYVNFIQDIKHVSVREEKANIALSKLVDKQIFTAVDPTALLTKEEWLRYIPTLQKTPKDYIFTYFIGVNKKQVKALDEISKKFGLKVLSYSLIPKEKHILKYCYTDGPLEFLARLKDAKLVITSSFHGTILSIILNKNFYVLLPNPKRRSRIDNILKVVGLQDRVIEDIKQLETMSLDDIDYKKPNEKLTKIRESSIRWLINAVESNE